MIEFKRAETQSKMTIISNLSLSLLIENSSNRPKFALSVNPVEINLSGPTFKNIILLIDEIVETTKNKETQIQKLLMKANYH